MLLYMFERGPLLYSVFYCVVGYVVGYFTIHNVVICILLYRGIFCRSVSGCTHVLQC